MIQHWLGPVAGIVAGAFLAWDAVRAWRRELVGWTSVLSSMCGGVVLTLTGFAMRGELIPSIFLGALGATMVLVPMRTWVRLIAGRNGLEQFDRTLAESERQEEDLKALRNPTRD